MSTTQAASSSSSDADASEQQVQALLQALQETTRRVASLQEGAMADHVHSSEFSAAKDGLDFLDTKNSLLLSYLIDLTVNLRQQLLDSESSSTNNNNSWHRFMEMKAALDKLRGLDKKLRYQLDKILSAATDSGAASFAARGDNGEQATTTATEEDPLQFRPNMEALEDEDNSDSDSSSSSSSNDEGSQDDNSDVDGHLEKRNKPDADNDEDDLDADLATARMTLSMANYKSDKKNRKTNQQEDEPSVYRAPRLTATPYTHDVADRQAEREKRQRRKLRTSELAQTLQAQYGDAPETDDMQGGSQLGRQRQAARRLAERDAEKRRFEEETMVRLTTTRQEKKERKRLMRNESSNLAAIADLGNLVRDVGEFGGDRDASSKRHHGYDDSSDRHLNGKRRRQRMDLDGQQRQHGHKQSFKSKNSLQEALFVAGGSKGGRRSSNKKRR